MTSLTKIFLLFYENQKRFFDRKNSNQSNCSYLWNSTYWRCLIKNLENTKNENNGPRFPKIQFWKLKNIEFFLNFEMARKWLNIEIIGHKWTQKEYKKGRSIGISKDRLRGFSKKFSQKQNMFDFLALESDAINANFDLVYSDAEIENHVRNRIDGPHSTTIQEYIQCILILLH